MNDTPETAIIKDLIENMNLWADEYRGKPISLSLFRAAMILAELERERDKLRRMSVTEMMVHNLNVKHYVTEWENRCLKAERERDEIQEKYDTLAVENMLEVNKLCKERDESREEANKLSGAYEDATNYYARIIELIDERDNALEELRKLKIILDVIKNETL